MELAIVAGLVLFGYNCNTAGKRRVGDRGSVTERPMVPRTREYATVPFQSDTFVEEADDRGRRLMDDSYQDAMCPEKTGVVVGGRAMPYFTSSARQATSPQMHQRNMELFTGVLDSCISKTGFYQEKQEVAPFFDPSTNRQRVTSSGSAGNPQITVGSSASGQLEDRFPTSTYLNEVSPVQSVRVGPGLNIPLDKTAAGGFQQFYRPPVQNVNEYRKNQLPGRAVPGASTIESNPTIPNVAKNVQGVSGETAMDAVRPAMPSRATTTGNVIRSQQVHQGCVNSTQDEPYSGIPGGVLPGPQAGIGDGYRAQKHSLSQPGDLNATASRRAVGAYWDYPVANQDTRRGDTVCAPPAPSPAGRAGDGSYTTNQYQAPATMRSLDVGNPNQTFLGPGQSRVERQGGNNSTIYTPPTTGRETMVGRSSTFVGQSGLTAPTDHHAAEPSAHGMKKAQALAYTPGGANQRLPPGRDNIGGGVRARGGVLEIGRAPASSANSTDYAALGEQTRRCNSGSSISPLDNRFGIEAQSNIINLSQNPYALPSWQEAA